MANAYPATTLDVLYTLILRGLPNTEMICINRLLQKLYNNERPTEADPHIIKVLRNYEKELTENTTWSDRLNQPDPMVESTRKELVEFLGNLVSMEHNRLEAIHSIWGYIGQVTLMTKELASRAYECSTETSVHRLINFIVEFFECYSNINRWIECNGGWEAIDPPKLQPMSVSSKNAANLLPFSPCSASAAPNPSSLDDIIFDEEASSLPVYVSKDQSSYGPEQSQQQFYQSSPSTSAGYSEIIPYGNSNACHSPYGGAQVTPSSQSRQLSNEPVHSQRLSQSPPKQQQSCYGRTRRRAS